MPKATFFARIFPHLFFLFLTSPVLSPEIENTSVYLFLFVPLVDPHFLTYLGTVRLDKRYLVASLAIFGLSIQYGNFPFLAKIVSILLVVSYLYYTHRIRAFYLYSYMALNVLVALVQFLGSVFFGMAILFPMKIGEFLYGSYALTTGDTGLEGLLFLYRFSGLSREPGFFSSLLIASFVLLIDDREVRRRKFFIVVHLLGILLGLSKISLAFFVIFLPAYFARRWVEYVPKWAIVLSTLAVMMAATQYLYDRVGVEFLDETLSHRTIGYAILKKLNPRDLLFGVGYRNIASRASEIPLIYQSIWYDKMPSAIVAGSGLSSLIIDSGLLYFLMLLLFTYYLNVGSYQLLLFLTFTINENPLTTSSFVLLGIFYILSNPAAFPPRAAPVSR